MPDLFAADPTLLAPLNAELPEGLNATLREMIEEIYLHLVEDEEAVAKLGLARLAEIAVGQVDRVAMKVGGSMFYLPRGIGAKLSARDREICALHRGNNGHQLARRFGLSEMRISQILKKWRQEEFARKQGKLPLDE